MLVNLYYDGFFLFITVLWCAPGRGAPGRCEANFRPSRGVGAGRSHFAPRAGALGRGEAILRPELGRWGGALMYFGPSGAPHAPGAPVIINMKFENIFSLIFLYKKKK